MDDSGIIRWLWDTGHFFSPGALKIDIVTAEDLATLSLSDAVTRAAVRSAQQWFAPTIDEYSLRSPRSGGHGRVAIADGDPGPAFIHMTGQPRCGHPDYVNPNATVEAGRFPDRCKDELVMAHRFGEARGGISGINTLVDEALWYLQEHVDATVIQDNEDAAANLYEVVRNQSGNVLAMHELAQNTCDQYRGWYDPRVFGSEPLFCAVLVHELMHGLGTGHSSDPRATIYPAITQHSMGRRGRMIQTDIDMLVGVGYKQIKPPKKRPDDPDDPPEPPGDDGKWTIAPHHISIESPSGETTRMRLTFSL